VIGSLVDDLAARGIRRQHIVLLGFSQGACLTAEFAFEHPARYGGIVIFSGGVIGETLQPAPEGATFAGTPVFFGCSDVDPHVPKARVNESAVLFRQLGAQVTERIYPAMGHFVNDDEILAARAIMDAVVTTGRGGV